MPTLLMRIRPAAKQCVEVMSDLLKVELSVLDENMERVTGSNQHMAKQARMRTNVAYENGVMTAAMRSGRTQIIERPREEGACLSCEAREACVEKFNISVPVVVDGRVCGGLAAIAMTERQKRRMEKNRELYAQTLERFAELLALKAREELERSTNEELAAFVEMLTDTPLHALIGISAAGEMTMLNSAAREILAVDAEELPQRVYLKQSEDDTWQLRLGNIEYQLRGRLFSVGMKDCAELFVFEQVSRGKRNKNRTSELLQGRSSAVQLLRERVAQYARSSVPVLITGESGTEQTALAVAIHEASLRQLQPFLSFNCRGSEARTEETLFGTVGDGERKGTPGLFERAKGGSVCLEHVECLQKPLQQRLLRLLETGEIYRGGAAEPTLLRARIMATSDYDLNTLAAADEFSTPLLYRLAPLPLRALSLREIGEDVSLLAKRYLLDAALRQGRKIRRIEPEVLAHIENTAWPGNLVQLRGEMERLVSLMGRDGEICAAMLYGDGTQRSLCADAGRGLDELERETIATALLRYEQNTAGKRAAAAELGISLATLYRKIKQYKL